MSLPKAIKDKYLARFDELIIIGEKLKTMIHADDTFGFRFVDIEAYNTWKVNCTTLIESIEQTSSDKKYSEMFREADSGECSYLKLLAIFKALKDDFEKGFLDSMHKQIEANLASDYMGQAEKLIDEGADGRYDHVPAAVLAGAVLEKSLRSLCESQTPPIETLKPNGEPFAMSALIDNLKKAGLYNEAKAKELRSFADIRNHAAHGHFDQFTKDQVKRMIEGINSFIANYM